VAGGIPGSIPFVQHLGLCAGFLGAAIAARERRLLALATGTFLPEGPIRRTAEVVSSTIAALIAAILFRGSIDLVVAERQVGQTIAAGVPVWVAELAFPRRCSCTAIWRPAAISGESLSTACRRSAAFS
jgi:C4-dicarboxylate transporter, DctM subunit